MSAFEELVEFLHRRGSSVTFFFDALRKWEELPPEERRKRIKEFEEGGTRHEGSRPRF